MQIRFIGPFKPYLAENISLQSSNFNKQPLWSSSLTKPDLLRFRCSSCRACSLQNEVGDPQFLFSFLTPLAHHLSMAKFSEKNKCWKIFARTSLIADFEIHSNTKECVSFHIHTRRKDLTNSETILIFSLQNVAIALC